MPRFERILIFELNWLGDILFSFPFLRAIREHFPQAYISCAVVSRYADLLVNSPWINDIHVFPDENGLKGLGKGLAFAKMITGKSYDTCFLLKPSKTRSIIATLAGIRNRISFSGKSAFLTEVVKSPPPEIHRADQILSLATIAGISGADGTYEYFISEEDRAMARDLLNRRGRREVRTVAINPGGNWGPKRWPSDSFIALGKELLSRFDDIDIMITGAEKDMETANGIICAIDSPRCYSVAGCTGLNELAALFEKCDLVVSADSGPLHLASAVGVDTIGLFGPTSPGVTGQRGRGCNVVILGNSGCEIPCYVENCDKGYECMKSISPGNVLAEAEKILEGNK